MVDIATSLFIQKNNISMEPASTIIVSNDIGNIEDLLNMVQKTMSQKQSTNPASDAPAKATNDCLPDFIPLDSPSSTNEDNTPKSRIVDLRHIRENSESSTPKKRHRVENPAAIVVTSNEELLIRSTIERLVRKLKTISLNHNDLVESYRAIKKIYKYDNIQRSDTKKDICRNIYLMYEKFLMVLSKIIHIDITEQAGLHAKTQLVTAYIRHDLLIFSMKSLLSLSAMSDNYNNDYLLHLVSTAVCMLGYFQDCRPHQYLIHTPYKSTKIYTKEICRHWRNGHCWLGEKCGFRHGN